MASEMLDYVRYNLRLRKLEREGQHLRQKNRKLIEQAKADRKKRDELSSLEHECMWEEKYVSDAIETLRTNRLLSLANRYVVPIPPRDNNVWERSDTNGEWMLTTEAFIQLRKAVRQEKKERRQAAIEWSSVIIGIIGAITGLVAVILK